MISKIVKFFEDVKTEMAKVSWPTREELMNSTMIVAVVGILFTAYIFLADIVLAKVIQLFL
jgi:preprotein translocase subunit SecE